MGRVTAALAVRSLDASVPVAAVTGTVALLLATTCLGYQIRRFRRAAAVVPQLYDSQSPGLPGWTERAQRQEA